MTTDDPTGFSRDYPARECPQLPNGWEWIEGWQSGYGAFRTGHPKSNPYPLGCDKWRGFEWFVCAKELERLDIVA